ncbi:MAG: SH3 domain-containing protein [Lachnospiraceae bacterium]|nr:SH3 domain-containing protein [Lachnospiraceae bacterium]MDD4524269.1 SH3 domain-containing protein [Lachnospiraceae bacterium]
MDKHQIDDKNIKSSHNSKTDKDPDNKMSFVEKITESAYKIKYLVMDHSRVVLPAFLIAIAAIIIIVALGAHNASAKRKSAEEAAAAAESAAAASTEIVIEENKYPDVNELMNTYFQAVADGDVDTISSISTSMDETEKIRIRKLGDYVDSYPSIDVYTKPGPVENSYICFVVTKVRFADYDAEIPGMQTMYVCTDENGSLYINEDESSSDVTDFIKQASLTDDVVDLNNKVTSDYNDLLADNEELSSFLDQLSSEIEVSIGEALADARADESDSSSEASSESSTDTGSSSDGSSAEDSSASSGSSATVAVAKESVAVRKTASTDGEQVGSVYQGDELDIVENMSNGWLKVKYDGETAYVKAEFFDLRKE